MRISTTYQFDSFSSRILDTQSRYFQAQAQVQTGRKLEKLSDDPFLGSFSVSARRIRSHIEQYENNLLAAKDYLGHSEQALAEMHGLLKRAYENAVRGASSATDQTGRNGLAMEIGQLQQRLLELANSQGGRQQYLFGGQVIDRRPFTLNGTTLDYHGNDAPILVETGPNETLKVNVDARTLVIEAYDRLERLKNNLEGGNIGAISGVDIDELQQSMTAVNRARGEVGSRLQTLQTMSERNTRRRDELTRQIADVEEVDLADAFMNLKLAETAYAAAMQIGAQSFRLSLLDYLRP